MGSQSILIPSNTIADTAKIITDCNVSIPLSWRASSLSLNLVFIVSPFPICDHEFVILKSKAREDAWKQIRKRDEIRTPGFRILAERGVSY